MKLLFTILFVCNILIAGESNIIKFSSKDSILITAKTYFTKSKENPLIILFHQAGWSYGEYNEIAPKLNQLGYNCIAINQRSGNEVNGVKNQTNINAKEKGKSTNYLDAYIDMEATLDYVHKMYAPKILIIWGSSYSAALSLKLAAEYEEIVDGVLSFSPGEYFEKLGKSKTFIIESAANLKCPVFITSAKNEKDNWEPIYNAIPSKDKIYFLPKTKGNHGSRALWEEFKDSKDYWTAVKQFLMNNFK